MKKFFLLGLLVVAAICCDAQEAKFAVVPELNSQQAIAYFASGCFWCVEGVYEGVFGVDEVISGYAAGAKKNPTYYNHENHTETVAVIYSRSKVSYEQLLQVFFEITNEYTMGQAPDFGVSYRSALFPKSGREQKAVSTALKKYPNHKIQVLPFEQANFHPAENYHQDYVKRLEAGKEVVNKAYGINVSIPRRNDFIRTTTIPLKKR